MTSTALAEPAQNEAEENASMAVTIKLEAATGQSVMQPVLIAREALKYNDFGRQAIAQVDKAVLNSPERFGLGGDLMKAINSNLKQLEETRKGYTAGLDALKSYLIELFTPGKDKLTKAKAALQTKLDVYSSAETKRLKEEAAVKAKALEDAALALASAQQSMGDDAGADKVMEDAAKLSAKVAESAKVVGHGVYGSTIGTQKRWVGTVTDPAKFVVWLGQTRPDEVSKIVSFGAAELNKLAKKQGEGENSHISIPGFTFEQTSKSVTR